MIILSKQSFDNFLDDYDKSISLSFWHSSFNFIWTNSCDTKTFRSSQIFNKKKEKLEKLFEEKKKAIEKIKNLQETINKGKVAELALPQEIKYIS